MYHVSAQGVEERMINVHYYYYYLDRTLSQSQLHTNWVGPDVSLHRVEDPDEAPLKTIIKTKSMFRKSPRFGKQFRNSGYRKQTQLAA